MMIVAGKKNFGFGGAETGGLGQDDAEGGVSTEVNWDDDETDDERRERDAAYGTSSILGKSYKPKTRHKMAPMLPDIKHNQSQVCQIKALFSLSLMFCFMYYTGFGSPTIRKRKRKVYCHKVKVRSVFALTGQLSFNPRSRCKEFERLPFLSVPINPIDFSEVKHGLGKTIDACTAYITTDMNGYPDV